MTWLFCGFLCLTEHGRRLLQSWLQRSSCPYACPREVPPALTLGFAQAIYLGCRGHRRTDAAGTWKTPWPGLIALLHLEAWAHRVKQTRLPCLGTHRACVPQPMPASHQRSARGRAGSASLPASRHRHVRAQQGPAMRPSPGDDRRPTGPSARVVCRH